MRFWGCESSKLIHKQDHTPRDDKIKAYACGYGQLQTLGKHSVDDLELELDD